MIRSRFYFLTALTILLTIPSRASDNWPEWRGPTGQGHADVSNLPSNWSESKNVAWKTSIPGKGWSTPVIANGQVWVTTATDTPTKKEDIPRRMKETTNSQPLTISSHVSLRAVCIDLASGKILRDIEVMTEDEPQMIHIENTYATPTAILSGSTLYCHYGTYGTAAIDTKSGKTLWTNRKLRVKHENGPGSSPILWGDHLIVHCDGIDYQYIVALDKHSGEIAWKTDRTGALNSNPQLRKSYATPLVVDDGTRDSVISPAADWLYGYDPATGTEQWKLNYGELGFSNSARPISGHGRIYLCTGYMKSKLLAIDLHSRNESGVPKILWKNTKSVPNVSSPLLLGDELYMVSDKGILSCVDAHSGETHWNQRLSGGYWASPIFGDGKMYFFGKNGSTTLIRPGKKFSKVATNKLDGQIYASGAAIDNALILRTDKALYRIQN